MCLSQSEGKNLEISQCSKCKYCSFFQDIFLSSIIHFPIDQRYFGRINFHQPIDYVP